MTLTDNLAKVGSLSLSTSEFNS